VEQLVRRAEATVAQRESVYRRGRPPPLLAGRSVVLVDDGLATGATVRAALDGVRPRLPAAVLVAVPVGAPATCEAIAQEVDALVCPVRPATFEAVGQAYRDFTATDDEQVRDALGGA
jgi:predicted phosphoribosyltransferase